MSHDYIERVLHRNGWRQAMFDGGVAVWRHGVSNVILVVSPVSTLRTVLRVINSVQESD